jgi:hypothetical protein
MLVGQYEELRTCPLYVTRAGFVSVCTCYAVRFVQTWKLRTEILNNACRLLAVYLSFVQNGFQGGFFVAQGCTSSLLHSWMACEIRPMRRAITVGCQMRNHGTLVNVTITGHGWRTFLRARAQIIVKFRRNSIAPM